MTFEDATLIRLADPAQRPGVFDEAALEQFLQAAYDTSLTPVGGPFSALFEEFRLGVPVLPVSTVDGSWGPQSGSERSAARLEVTGMSGPPLVVDAFWRGAVVTRTSAPSGVITEVVTSWPSTEEVDQEIIQSLNGLPANPAVLEQERRSRILVRLRAGMKNGAALTDSVFDSMLAQIGAGSVSEWFDRGRGVNLAGSVTITMEERPAPPPSPRALPVAAAVLVRGSVSPLARLLMESRMVRQCLESNGLARPEEPNFRALQSILVIWVIPESVFDDDSWPGAMPGDAAAAKRAKRRLAAGQWLAKEGIGLAPLPV